MQRGERPAGLILSIAAIFLVIISGLAIPLASGNRISGKVTPWTPSAATTPAPIPPKLLAAATLKPHPAATLMPALPSATPPAPQATAHRIPVAASVPTLTAAPAETVQTPAAPTVSAPADLTARILAEPVNLRTGPGTAYAPLGIAKIGEIYRLFSRSSDGAWLQLCCVQGARAWVNAQFVSINGAIDTLPTAP